MKFLIKTEDFLTELQLLQGVIEKKTTIPILSNLLIRTTDNGIELEATDLEVGIKTKATAVVKAAGEVTVNARKLHDLVRSMSGMDLEFNLQEKKNLQITGPNVEYKIPIIPSGEYPGVPTTDFKDAQELPVDEFRESIAKTIIAAAVDDTRYTLNGIFIKMDSAKIVLVASDAHRLAISEIEAKLDGIAEEINFIMPRKGSQEVVNLLKDKRENEKLLFKKEQNNLFFKYGERILVTRIIEGNYPQYEKVIPQENKSVVGFNREEIHRIISRIDLVANEKSHAIIFELNPEKVRLRSFSPESGEGEENLKVDYEGNKFKVGFNARYIIDFLNVATSKTVLFKFNDEKTAGLFIEKESEKYMYIVSPIKL